MVGGKNMMNRMTSLGFDERLERVLAYSLGWVSGLILFFLEKNRNVRWHAVQSMVTFGSLSILMFAISLLKGFLAWIPLLGWLTSAGLGLLLSVLWWVTIILWVWLMVMAFVKEDYRLPFVSDFVRYWV
jgi:uncharacterized membrane protein